MLRSRLDGGDLSRRLEHIAPVLGAAGCREAVTGRSRLLRNVASHCFDRPMAELELLTGTELNEVQRGRRRQRRLRADAPAFQPAVVRLESRVFPDPLTTCREVFKAPLCAPPCGAISLFPTALVAFEVHVEKYIVVQVPSDASVCDAVRSLDGHHVDAGASAGACSDGHSARVVVGANNSGRQRAANLIGRWWRFTARPYVAKVVTEVRAFFEVRASSLAVADSDMVDDVVADYLEKHELEILSDEGFNSMVRLVRHVARRFGTPDAVGGLQPLSLTCGG